MTTNSLSVIKKRRKDILERWMSNQLSDFSLREDLMSNAELRQQSDELLTSLLDAVASGNDDIESSEYVSVVEILASISASRAQQGFTPRETGTFVLSLKKAIFDVLQEEYKDNITDLYTSILRINKILDDLSMLTFETFIRGRESVIFRQTQEINEISTPVIRVWKGIVAMPIIGTLDSARTQVIMESLLQEIVESGSNIAILDISGVPAVDSLVAQHLIKTVSATRLMGAECIISGIRSEIAQTIVHLGIDLSSIQTKASLAAALRYAFALMKLEVIKAEK